jgi:signal transduction histidine kinase
LFGISCPRGFCTSTKELKTPIPSLNDAQNKVFKYISEGIKFEEKDSFELALEPYREAMDIVEYYNLEIANKELCLRLGTVYYAIHNYERAVFYLSESLINNPNILRKNKSKAVHKLSLAYRFLGDLEWAFEYELLNLEIVEGLDDKKGMWRSNYQLGNILVFKEDYVGALDYYIKTEELSHHIEKLQFKYSTWGALGNVYDQLDSMDLALEYNFKALQLAQDIDYEIGISYSYYNLANNYYEKKEIEKALDYHFKSLEIKEKVKDKWGIVSSSRMLTNIFLELENYSESKKYLDKGLKLAEELNTKPALEDLYKSAADFYAATGNYKLSNEFLNSHVEIKNEMVNEQSLRKLKSKKTAYELQKRDQEIKDLKKDRDIQTVKMWTFVAAGLSICPFILLLIFGYAKLRKTKKQLEETNRLIESQNDALEESNKELEEFAYVASHDMREPIRTIRSFNSLLKKRYGEVLGEQGMEFVNFIDNASARMDTMLTDLLNYSRVNSNKDNMEVINLADSAVLAAKNLTSKFYGQDIKLNVGDLPNVNVNPIQMERLFQNLIANGVKYNDKEEKIINITHERNSNTYVIAVNDNGIGIPEEYQHKVFEIFRRLHGTAEYEGSGIGLATCKKIVERHKGKIWLESEPEVGTTFFFSIPIDKRAFKKELPKRMAAII